MPFAKVLDGLRQAGSVLPEEAAGADDNESSFGQFRAEKQRGPTTQSGNLVDRCGRRVMQSNNSRSTDSDLFFGRP